jgi:hypothetical protein
MSDHGGAFKRGHPHRIMNEANYRELVAAPMFVKVPQQRSGRADERRVSGLDLVPTIADVLGSPVPWRVDGSSVLGAEFPERAVLEYKGLDLPLLQAFDVRAEARNRPTAGAMPEQQSLAGKAIAELDVLPEAAGMQVLSDSFRAFRSVREDRAFIPALVEGRIERSDSSTAPLRLAIAVNGVVQAVTTTSAWYGSPHYFGAFVPESSIRPGANTLDVFALDGTPSSLRLARIDSALADGLTLVRRSGGEALLLGDGRQVPLAADVIGFVDRVDEHADAIALHGWAIDQRAARELRTIVVVSGTSSVAFGYPAAPRGDVAAAMNVPAATNVTFSVKVSRQDLQRQALARASASGRAK